VRRRQTQVISADHLIGNGVSRANLSRECDRAPCGVLGSKGLAVRCSILIF